MRVETQNIDMSAFEADVTNYNTEEITALEDKMTMLDAFGIEYPDLGQQEIAIASGTGNSNNCDLDGE